MKKRPTVVAFDVMETLFSLEPMRPRLQAIGLPAHSLHAWYTRLIHDGIPRGVGRGLADGGTAWQVGGGSPVNYAVTVPGPAGQGDAFLAEFLISFGLMLAVLIVSNIRRTARFTGLFAGALMAIYLVVERPFSGMSMNPARTFASAVPAITWTDIWLYFAAPLLGMMLAGELYLRSFGRIYCAKLHHDNDYRCIFHHGYDRGRGEPANSSTGQSLQWMGSSTPRLQKGLDQGER